MALDYVIDDRLVIITGDYADAAEWKRLATAIASDPRFRPGSAFLRDQRESLHPKDVASVVAAVEVVLGLWPFMRPCRAAIVSRPGADDAALVPHAMADARQLPIRAFDSYDAAIEWLRAGLGTPGDRVQ